MKTRNLFFLFIAVMFAITACDDTNNPVNPTDKPVAPKNLQATSKSNTSVLLRWTPSTSESNSNFDKYVLTVSGGSYPIQPFNINKGVSSVGVTNLIEGTIYTFSIVAKFTDGTTSEDTAKVQWSPATRFTRNQNDAPIWIYETASDYGSGLVIFDPVGDGPKSAKVSNGGVWNLGLDTRDGNLILASAGLIDYNYNIQPGVTEIANDIYTADSLDDVFDSQALDSKGFAERSIDLTKFSSSIVIVVRFKQAGKSDYNYAKVLVKNNSGTFLQDESPNRYVEFEISYQKVTGVPYAKVPTISQNVKINIIK